MHPAAREALDGVAPAAQASAATALLTTAESGPRSRPTEPLRTVELRQWATRLADLDGDVPDAERIDQLRTLESLKAAAAAAQARVAVAFESSQRATQAAAGVPAAQRGAGVAEQVALARRESPTRGSRHLGLAKALVEEMPHTLTALTRGEISEWRATLVVKATAVLDVEDRRAVDTELAGRLGGLSDRAVDAAARAAAYHRDPQSVVRRREQVEADRRVSVRPAPELMAWVSALVPMVQGVAVFKALRTAAEGIRASGDSRPLAQIEADTFVERLTGQATATAVPVEVGVVMTDTALVGTADVPARVEHYGPIPAAAARALIRIGGDAGARAWVRRLLTDPLTGQVSAVDLRRRRFPEHVRRLVVARDQWCRTPWCGAPIRHIDHVTGYAVGGPTDLDNAQGLCERCNHAKQALGWQATVEPEPEHSPGARGTIRPPTGHVYWSEAPPALPGVPSGPQTPS